MCSCEHNYIQTFLLLHINKFTKPCRKCKLTPQVPSPIQIWEDDRGEGKVRAHVSVHVAFSKSCRGLQCQFLRYYLNLQSKESRDLTSFRHINKKLLPAVESKYKEGKFNTPRAEESPRMCFIRETLETPKVSKFLMEWSRSWNIKLEEGTS